MSGSEDEREDFGVADEHSLLPGKLSFLKLFVSLCKEDPSLSHLSGLRLALALASHEYSAPALRGTLS